MERRVSDTNEQLVKFQREAARMSERGIYCGKAPGPMSASYDDGFKSAFAHVAAVLQLIIDGKPYTDYEP